MEKHFIAYKEFIAYIRSLKRIKNQTLLITLLRQYNYRFLQKDFIIAYDLSIEIEDRHKGLMFMTRALKGKKEKYDINIAFGFDLSHKKQKVVLYFIGKYDHSWKLPWPEAQKINFKKVNKTKFPRGMEMTQREYWRKLDQRVIRKKKLQEKDQLFYDKWKDKIIKPVA